MLNANHQLPKYAQIAHAIRQRIARQEWAREERLPANEELATEYGASRITVRQALNLLVVEGLLEARQGRGTYVVGDVQQEPWIAVELDLTSLLAQYQHLTPELITFEEVQGVPLRDGGDPQAKYVRMRRLHLRKGKPYCVISIYLLESVFKRAPARFRNELVIPVLLEMADVEIASANQVLTVSSADVEAARHLGIPIAFPVAEVRRTFRGKDGNVLYLGDIVYRGDQVRIEMSLN